MMNGSNKNQKFPFYLTADYTFTPCITSVQCLGGVQYCGGYDDAFGGYLEYRGDIISTVGDTQYHGGCHDAHGGIS